MTLVAVWRVENRLMSAADTRIARAPGNVLTEHGPKLLPIKVRGRQPGPSGFFDRESFRSDIGFGYSGATLPALSSHALANTLLGNLAGPSGCPPPSMDQIACFIRGVAAEYMREIGELSGNNALFGAIVFGFCHAAERFRGFEIRPGINYSTLTCDVIEHDLRENNSVIVIGSCPDLLLQRIEADRAAAIERGDTNSVLDIDRPVRALQALIDEGVHPSFGGMIQQGWATAAGFEVVAKIYPIIRRSPSARNIGLFMLGFDIMDMQQVGSYFVGPTGR